MEDYQKLGPSLPCSLVEKKVKKEEWLIDLRPERHFRKSIYDFGPFGFAQDRFWIWDWAK
jgi:hypothetical protein